MQNYVYVMSIIILQYLYTVQFINRVTLTGKS